MDLPQDVLAGDVLLYEGYWAVREACAADVGHAVCVADTKTVFTSDVEKGVAYYDLDSVGEVVHWLRPEAPFDLDAARKWFAPLIGTPYGWAEDLMDINVVLSIGGNGMNCSHVTAAVLRAGGVDVVASYFNLRRIRPCDLLLLKGFRQLK